MANFFANLGQGLNRFGAYLSPEFESGANLGGALKDRFKKRPGDPGAMAGQPSVGPAPLNPATATDMLENAVADGENSARAKLPVIPRVSADPALEEAAMGELRAAGATAPALPEVSERGRVPLRTASPSIPNMSMSAPPKFEPSTLRDYRGRDISNDPIGFERNQYMGKHMEPDGGYKRDWKMSLRNALLGAGQALSQGGGVEGAIGAAGAGLAGSLISPRAGYEVGFELGERPRLEADIKRAREQEAYQRGQRMAGYDEAKKRGEIDLLPIQMDQERAQTEQIRASVDIARQNAERQRLESESRIALDKARAEALKQGKPKEIEVEQADGSIHIIRVWPDNTREDLGPSGRAAISRERNESAERRAGTTAAAGITKTGMSVAGAKERKQMEIDARKDTAQAAGGGQSKLQAARQKSQGGQGGGQRVNADQLQRYAASRKMTPEAAKQKLRGLGYAVD